MSVGTMTAELKKLFEDSGFGGSIWGNSPPMKGSTATMDRPLEATVSLTLTRKEAENMITALQTSDMELSDTGNIVAKLKQALV